MKSKDDAKSLKLAFLSAIMNGDIDRAKELKARVKEYTPEKHIMISCKAGSYELDGQHFAVDGIKTHLQAQQRRFKLSGVLVGPIDESHAILSTLTGPGTWFILPDNNR